MHTISLNLVKNALLDLIDDDTNGINWSIVDDRLDHMPWPSGKFLPSCLYLKQSDYSVIAQVDTVLSTLLFDKTSKM